MIDFSGPFFTKDPAKTFMQNVKTMMQAFADEGAAAVRERMSAGEGTRALIRLLDDRVSDHVIGRVHARSGKEWTAAAVVQVYNEGFNAAQSRSLMAAASRVEGQTRAIKNITRQLRSARAVLRANLTAGLE